VIVIEHNLDVIKTADWILDLGPEGGDEGGEIIAQGPPERVAKVPESYTGQFLAESLGMEAEHAGAGADGSKGSGGRSGKGRGGGAVKGTRGTRGARAVRGVAG
jgi:hypothetical protein